jgi:hypothetical protein
MVRGHRSKQKHVRDADLARLEARPQGARLPFFGFKALGRQKNTTRCYVLQYYC